MFSGPGVIFGGQLLAQTIVAASHDEPSKRVKTIHTIFARGGAPERGVEIGVEVMHSGRAFASSTVTISQGERLCTRSLVLLCADDPEVISHADQMPQVGNPLDAFPGSHTGGAWEVRIVDGVDISDPDAVGPAELHVWTRFVGAPDDVLTGQALLAYATDGFLIGTAMRPHAGVGQSQAHVTLSTGVISHTLTFHEPFAASGASIRRTTTPRAAGSATTGWLSARATKSTERQSAAYWETHRTV